MKQQLKLFWHSAKTTLHFPSFSPPCKHFHSVSADKSNDTKVANSLEQKKKNKSKTLTVARRSNPFLYLYRLLMRCRSREKRTISTPLPPVAQLGEHFPIAIQPKWRQILRNFKPEMTVTRAQRRAGRRNRESVREAGASASADSIPAPTTLCRCASTCATHNCTLK